MPLLLERVPDSRKGWLEGRGQRSHMEGEVGDEGLYPVNFPVCALAYSTRKEPPFVHYGFLHSLTHSSINSTHLYFDRNLIRVLVTRGDGL